MPGSHIKSVKLSGRYYPDLAPSHEMTIHYKNGEVKEIGMVSDIKIFKQYRQYLSNKDLGCIRRGVASAIKHYPHHEMYRLTPLEQRDLLKRASSLRKKQLSDDDKYLPPDVAPYELDDYEMEGLERIFDSYNHWSDWSDSQLQNSQVNNLYGLFYSPEHLNGEGEENNEQAIATTGYQMS